jgi:hypothetical protein
MSNRPDSGIVKTRVIVDIGSSTILLLAELILVLLKITGYITYSWELVLSPIIVIVAGATFILLYTLLSLIKNHLF